MKGTAAYQMLVSSPWEDMRRPMKPMATLGEGHTEYSDEIADFATTVAKSTNRTIPPYQCKKVHGEQVYTEFIQLINTSEAESVLDLGCGSGELLLELLRLGYDVDELYGCTIHVGECKAALAFGLKHVAAIDMRELSTYYLPGSFDCIVSFWGMNYISPSDRASVLQQAYSTLKAGGSFFGVDYFGQPNTTLPTGVFDLERVYPSNFGTTYCFGKRQR